MNEKSKNLIKEKMLNLPKYSQKAITASSWEKILEEIGKKHLLDENEMNSFKLETVSLLLGLVDEDAYPQNIEDSVGINKDESKQISEEVIQKILQPISYSLGKNIENNLKTKKPTWKQSVNFILSGGDYSVFLEEDDSSNVASRDSKMNTLDESREIEDIKNKFVI